MGLLFINMHPSITIQFLSLIYIPIKAKYAWEKNIRTQIHTHACTHTRTHTHAHTHTL